MPDRDYDRPAMFLVHDSDGRHAGEVYFACVSCVDSLVGGMRLFNQSAAPTVEPASAKVEGRHQACDVCDRAA